MGKGGYIVKTLHKEGEHRVIVPAHYRYNEEKKYKPNFKQLLSSWKGILGVSATLATILAVVFPAYQYLSEKPNLNVVTQSLELQSTTTILQTLDDIEYEYSDITGNVILDLQIEVELLLESNIKTPSESFYDKTEEIEINIDEDDINQIKELIEKSITEIEELMQKHEESIKTINAKLENHEENDLEVLLIDKERLGGVKERLENLLKNIVLDIEGKRRLNLNLLVENHSNSQNGIRETAVVRFYKNKEVHFPVVLKLNHNNYEDIIIDRNKFKLFKFQSRLLNAFSEDEREFIKSAFENQYSYILVIEDIQGELWSEEDTVLNFKLDSRSNKLIYETEMILKKKSTNR